VPERVELRELAAVGDVWQRHHPARELAPPARCEVGHQQIKQRPQQVGDQVADVDAEDRERRHDLPAEPAGGLAATSGGADAPISARRQKHVAPVG